MANGSMLRSCAAVVVFGALAGCANADRDARRRDAIDVAGSYEDAAAAVSIVVDDEADKNDVVVTVTRAAVFAGEADLTAGFDVDALVLELGRGPDGLRDEVDGGENVSFDGGDSTVVSVDGDDVVAGDAVVRWSLRLDGDAAGLTGVLTVSKRVRQPHAGDADGQATESQQQQSPAFAFVPVAR